MANPFRRGRFAIRWTGFLGREKRIGESAKQKGG